MRSKLKFIAVVLLYGISIQTVVAGDLRVTFSDDDGNLLNDAVIEIVSPTISIPDDWGYSGVMDQIDKEFVENVITVVAGTKVMFPNSDNIHHHVYSFSDNNTFELPLYIGDSSAPIAFENEGVTVVGCNIHDWMLGYIYVGQSHLMAKTKEDGIALIQGLEPGDYTFTVWHPRIRRRENGQSHTLTVAAGVAEYAVELNLGRDRRIRRAPSAGGREY